MNRLEIREAVRDILGEQHEGFWTNAELDRYIQLACNRHAQEALSVAKTQSTTSLPGIQEYVLPRYFGEMRRVRWHTDTNEVWTLHNAPKTDVINRNGSEFLTLTGEPRVYYHDNDRIGLYPVPNKPPVIDNSPPADCEDWQTLDTSRNADGHVDGIYSEDVYIELQDSCEIYCSHVSLWMRRNARLVQGAFRLRIHPIGQPDYEYWFSRWINTTDLQVEPGWLHFDFTHHPVELMPETTQYNFTFILDEDFYTVTRADYGDDGPQFAVEQDSAGSHLYYQFHQFKQDIELDFYSNEADEIETDYDDLDVPDRYHRTLIDMVAARALRKNARDMNTSLILEAKVDKEIKAARAQSALRTRGRSIRTEGAHRYYGPDATYNDGFWRIRAW